MNWTSLIFFLVITQPSARAGVVIANLREFHARTLIADSDCIDIFMRTRATNAFVLLSFARIR